MVVNYRQSKVKDVLLNKTTMSSIHRFGNPKDPPHHPGLFQPRMPWYQPPWYQPPQYQPPWLKTPDQKTMTMSDPGTGYNQPPWYQPPWYQQERTTMNDPGKGHNRIEPE